MPTPTTKKANLGAAWMSDSDIRTALTKIQQNRVRHENLMMSAEVRINGRRKELERSLESIGERDRGSMVNKAISSFRSELARESRDVRLAMTRELGALAERVRSAATHYASPMQMLMRETLGSERRGRIQMQIETSGPVELASLAELAAATRDREMAAALCSRVHGLKRDDRSFNAGELADVMFGEQHRELSQALVEAERRVLEALQADQKFETGKGNPQRALQIAMLKKREAEIGAYVKDEPEDEPEAEADAEEPAGPGEDKIAAGLKARRAPATEAAD